MTVAVTPHARSPGGTASAQTGPGLEPADRQEELFSRLRQVEFARLDATGQVYLDYTGGGLYGSSQVRRHAEALLSGVFGNPHSENPTSSASTELVERARRRVLEFFRADPEEYAAVFTANASHALKLVGESYPFEPGDRLLLTFDNHNSVNGIREFDRAHGAGTTYVPLAADLRVDEAILDRHLETVPEGHHHLFAFPAQSNFSGAQHPLDWIAEAQGRGWDVLLDAAAFVPTHRLDLGRFKPDFVTLSFYKMFGYPTGLGALIGRRDALARLHRPWFAGGTIAVASVRSDRYVAADGEAAFEDGTLSYNAIPAIEYGLDLLDSVGIDNIHRRVRWLTGWLLERLLALRHPNGRPLIHLYGPAGVEGRGGTLALNFYDRDGRVVDHERVERLAAGRRLSIRTGCFCNPGAGESALGLSKQQIDRCLEGSRERVSADEFRRCVASLEGGGAVRVSLGPPTNLADLEAFVGLAEALM